MAGITRAVCISDTNEVSDNNITIESYEGIGLDVVFDGNCNYIGNTVVSNEPVNRVFSGDCYVVENDITINGNVEEIGYNATYVKNNDIVVKGTLTKTGFNYYGSTWKKDYQVLKKAPPKGSFFCLLFRTEKTVACVTESGQNVAVFVELSIQRRNVNVHVGMCLRNLGNPFGRTDNRHKANVRTPLLFQERNGVARTAPRCEHRIDE